MIVRCLFALFCLTCFAEANAQVILHPKQQQTKPVGVIYKKEHALYLQLHTRGFGAGLVFGDLKTYYKTDFKFFEFSKLKHIKESAAETGLRTNTIGRPYIFGKKNTFFTLKGGIGRKIYLSEKTKKKGVAIGYSYRIGPIIGLIKPYYLDLSSELTPSDINSEKYSEENKDRFLDAKYIEGYSGFWKGIEETDLTVGAHIGVASHFSWGAYEKYVRALEAGIQFDLFASKVPIMVNEDDNKRLFINLYLHLYFGKRK